MSISYPPSDSNMNDPRSPDSLPVESSAVHSTAGRRSDEKQINAEPADPPSAPPTPLRGQVETNQPISGEEAANLVNEAEAREIISSDDREAVLGSRN